MRKSSSRAFQKVRGSAALEEPGSARTNQAHPHVSAGQITACVCERPSNPVLCREETAFSAKGAGKFQQRAPVGPPEQTGGTAHSHFPLSEENQVSNYHSEKPRPNRTRNTRTARRSSGRPFGDPALGTARRRTPQHGHRNAGRTRAWPAQLSSVPRGSYPTLASAFNTLLAPQNGRFPPRAAILPPRRPVFPLGRAVRAAPYTADPTDGPQPSLPRSARKRPRSLPPRGAPRRATGAGKGRSAGRAALAHLVVVVLAVAGPLGEDGEDVVGRGGVGRAEGERRGGAGGGGGGAGGEALDEVVLGEADALVRPHAVVAQVLLAVQAARAGGVALVAGAAARLALPAVRPPQQQRRRAAAARGGGRGGGGRGGAGGGRGGGGGGGAVRRRAAVVAVVGPAAPRAGAGGGPGAGGAAVLLLVGGGRHHHDVQQVAEEEVGGGQRVHARGLRDHHLLVADGAAQLERVPRGGVPLRLQALAAEGVQAGQDVQPPRRAPARRAAAPRGARGLRRGRRGGRVGGERGGRAAHLLAQRAHLEVGLRERSHWRRGGRGRRGPARAGSGAGRAALRAGRGGLSAGSRASLRRSARRERGAGSAHAASSIRRCGSRGRRPARPRFGVTALSARRPLPAA